MNRLRDMIDPPEEKRQDGVISALETMIDLVKMKACLTCKHSEKRNLHICDSNEPCVFCKKKNSFGISTCDEYEVRSVDCLFN